MVYSGDERVYRQRERTKGTIPFDMQFVKLFATVLTVATLALASPSAAPCQTCEQCARFGICTPNLTELSTHSRIVWDSVC